ncbi:AAC(3) family N-acetyltransferase [Noviherbaspirillum massiliense]|uniref:AAC(3) family N-acetyltransferase n=1 Tax=Noviherbaspirillum massiliense TaxID=1465823 RepID=UPI000380A58E
MNKLITGDQILEGLTQLGIKKGDTLYVRARVSAVGRTAEKNVLLLSIIDAIGSEGTAIFPAFTGYGLRWARNKKKFSSSSTSRSGLLSQLALDHPSAIRSLHPSHSFVAIGPKARDLLFDHDHTKSAFYPVKKMIENKCKMLLIGCNKESPGFSTVHYAQEQLRLSHGHLTKFLCSVQIEVNNKWVDWRPVEDPGCSRGFDKLYRQYIHDEILTVGRIGNAYSLLANAQDLYKIDHEILSKNPLAVLCDDQACISCRGLRSYNLLAMPLGIARHAYQRFSKRLSVLRS